jgi:hypothetical protein
LSTLNEHFEHKTCKGEPCVRLKTESNRVRSSNPWLLTEVSMISLADLIGFCDLTPDEVQAIAEHENIAETTAVMLGCHLLQSERGCEQIRDMLVDNMLVDNMRAAVRQRNVPRARHLVATLRHFLHEHPGAAFRQAA